MGLARKTPLRAKTPLVRRTPLRQVSEKKAATGQVKPALRASAPAKRLPTPAVPVDVRDALRVRSAGWCEIAVPGCYGQATDPAHRVKQGMGGRKGAAKKANDRLSNVLHACRWCHDACHRAPAEAYRWGWMLREGQVPSQEPVLYRGRLVFLDDAGGVHDYEAGAA